MFARSRLVLASLFLALTFGTADAGGSIPLPEVMQQLEGEESLIAEIEAELEAQDVEADDVTVPAPGSETNGRNWAAPARSPSNASSANASCRLRAS